MQLENVKNSIMMCFTFALIKTEFFYLVYWLKNGNVLVPSPKSNFMQTEEGSLILRTQDHKDSGNYTCVAKNLVSKRISHSARIVVSGQSAYLAQVGFDAITVSVNFDFYYLFKVSFSQRKLVKLVKLVRM